MKEGSRFGDLVLTERIAIGGMGTVFVADQDGQARVVKILHPHLAASPELRERFLQEARLSQRITHPNLVRIHGLVSHEDQLGLVMERVRI